MQTAAQAALGIDPLGIEGGAEDPLERADRSIERDIAGYPELDVVDRGIGERHVFAGELVLDQFEREPGDWFGEELRLDHVLPEADVLAADAAAQHEPELSRLRDACIDLGDPEGDGEDAVRRDRRSAEDGLPGVDNLDEVATASVPDAEGVHLGAAVVIGETAVQERAEDPLRPRKVRHREVDVIEALQVHIHRSRQKKNETPS